MKEVNYIGIGTVFKKDKSIHLGLSFLSPSTKFLVEGLKTRLSKESYIILFALNTLELRIAHDVQIFKIRCLV